MLLKHTYVLDAILICSRHELTTLPLIRRKGANMVQNRNRVAGTIRYDFRSTRQYVTDANLATIRTGFAQGTDPRSLSRRCGSR